MKQCQLHGSKTKVLQLTLLGCFEICVNAAPIDVGYSKLRGLLVFLAMSADRPFRREYLAEVFWPEMPVAVARQNLRRALYNLRLAMNEAGHLISVKRDVVSLARVDSWLDVFEFTTIASSCSISTPVHCSPCLAQMEQKAELYRGTFLAEFSLPGCPVFEDWLQAKRESLHRFALALLEKLSNCHEENGNYSRALQFTLRYIELEPWSEDGHCRAMRLYALNRQSSAAIGLYEAYCRQLKKELGILPNEETRQLAERIRRGELRRDSRSTVESALQTIP